MIRRLPLFTILLLTACDQANQAQRTELAEMKAPQLLHPEYDWGEYIRVLDSNTIVTAKRGEGSTGLVSVDIMAGNYQMLDSDAKEARDIFVSSGAIAYRVNNAARIYFNSKVLKTTISIERLRGFIKTDSNFILFYEQSGQGFRSVFDLAGNFVSFTNLPGLPRWVLIDQAKHERLLYLTEKGLYLDDQLIDEPKTGSYVQSKEIGDKIYLSWFSDANGILKIWDISRPPQEVQIVDGILDQSQTGHDMAIFDDQGNPGLIYLDALNLKLRLARKSGDKWKSVQLPIRGAVGFYNQLVSQSGSKIKIASHNFRSILEGETNSYEDLMIVDLDLTDSKK